MTCCFFSLIVRLPALRSVSLLCTPLRGLRTHHQLQCSAVADVIKEDSPQAVRELRNMGIHVVMLTGDNEHTARAIGAQAGVDQVIAGVLPEGKEAAIRRLMQRGKVAMVGDGINDAPALTRADTGIAIGAGADVAIDAADVVLMNSSLPDVPAAIRLSRATLRNIHENLFWAFFYNAIGIPLAAGVFIPLGLTLNPMFGAAAMSLSSFCVVSNALRLNLFKLRDNRHDHKRTNHLNNEIKEEQAMEKTLEIKGMMCPHCEATVRTALEALPQVQEAQVSHQTGTAVVTLTGPVEDDILRGVYREEEQVPSTNELSRVYHINPATAAKGLNLLVDEGILYKKRGIGMFVAAGSKQKIIQKRKDSFFETYVRSLVDEARTLAIGKEELMAMIEQAAADKT